MQSLQGIAWKYQIVECSKDNMWPGEFAIVESFVVAIGALSCKVSKTALRKRRNWLTWVERENGVILVAVEPEDAKLQPWV